MAENKKSATASQVVVWDGNRHHFESREMRPQDWRFAGASEEDVQEMEAVEWNSANNWRVPRSEIPLSDVQLGEFMARNGFRLADA